MRLGDVLYPQRLVRGFPQDIPSGAAVTVRGFAHFTKTGKWSKRPHADGRTRVRVEYRGHEYWVDAEALSAEKTSYSANPKPWTAVFENPTKNVEGVTWYKYTVRYKLKGERRSRSLTTWSPGEPWIRTELGRLLDEKYGIDNIEPGSVTYVETR